jgi:hypothetical protein
MHFCGIQIIRGVGLESVRLYCASRYLGGYDAHGKPIPLRMKDGSPIQCEEELRERVAEVLFKKVQDDDIM